MKFVFDLDGTVTRHETLPLIARHFGLQDEIDALTRQTIAGRVPFAESLARRVAILGPCSVGAVDAILSRTELFEGVMRFIADNARDCVVATGNLDVWTASLAARFPCAFHASTAAVADDRVVALTRVLRKASVVEDLQRAGHAVVYVGDGDNDAEAMRRADHAIGCGLVHRPAQSVMDAADAVAFDEAALLRLLRAMARRGAPA